MKLNIFILTKFFFNRILEEACQQNKCNPSAMIRMWVRALPLVVPSDVQYNTNIQNTSPQLNDVSYRMNAKQCSNNVAPKEKINGKCGSFGSESTTKIAARSEKVLDILQTRLLIHRPKVRDIY